MLGISVLRNSVLFPVSWKTSKKGSLDRSLTSTTGPLLSSLLYHSAMGWASMFQWHRYKPEQVKNSRRKSHRMVNSPPFYGISVFQTFLQSSMPSGVECKLQIKFIIKDNGFFVHHICYPAISSLHLLSEYDHYKICYLRKQ